MTFQDLRDEVGLRLSVDGASIYDYVNWDTVAINALKRSLDEFIIASKYRWVDRATIALPTTTREVSIAGVVADPQIVFIAGSQIKEVRMEILQMGGLEIATAPPTMWASDTPYSLTLDSIPDAATAALTTNAVSGWAAHSPITQVATSGPTLSTPLDITTPEHFRHLVAFCVYTMMSDSVSDSASSQRARANASNAYEFIRARSAEMAQKHWQ